MGRRRGGGRARAAPSGRRGCRKAAGYGGAPASEAVGERDLGLADGIQ